MKTNYLNLFKCLTFILFLTIDPKISLAQSNFTFQSLHPESNIDSLETWLKQNPKPSILRLKNLIKAERTYVYFGDANEGAFFKEIESLAKYYKSETAQDILTYLKYSRLKNQFDKKIFLDGLQLIEKYTEKKDSVFLVSLLKTKLENLLTHQSEEGRSEMVMIAQQIEKYYRKNRDLHETLAYLDYKTLNIPLTIKSSFNDKKYFGVIENTDASENALKFCLEHPQLAYAKYAQKYGLLINLFDSSDCNSAADSIQNFIKTLPQRAVVLRGIAWATLGDECILKFTPNQRISALQNSLVYLNKSQSPRISLYKYAVFYNLRLENQRIKNFEVANALADSAALYYEAFVANKSEFSSVYANAKFNVQLKEKEITRVENEKKLYLFIITIFTVFLIVVIILILFLRKSNKEINATRLLQDKLFMIIAHDLKSPLNTYQRFSEIVKFLLKTKQFERLDEVLIQIDEIGFNMAGLLDSLLKWSQVQQNSKINLQKVEMERVINGVLPIYRDMAQLKSINLVENLTNAEVVSDIDSLAFIIRNLLDNAIKYSSEGSTVQIMTDEKPDYLLLSITNNVIHYSDEFIKKVTGFFSGENKYEIGEEGLGIGIILIKQFADRINVRLAIDTIQNDTYIFKVYIPHNNIISTF